MLRLALAAASKRGAAAAVENVFPSTSAAAAAAFTRSFAALPATTSEPSSPFLRFASPAPAAHDFTPALQGLPETKVKEALRREKKRDEKRSVDAAIIEIAHRVSSCALPLSLSSLSLSLRGPTKRLSVLVRAVLADARLLLVAPSSLEAKGETEGVSAKAQGRTER